MCVVTGIDEAGLEMLHTDGLKEGVIPFFLTQIKSKSSLATFLAQFSYNMTIDKL